MTTKINISLSPGVSAEDAIAMISIKWYSPEDPDGLTSCKIVTGAKADVGTQIASLVDRLLRDLPPKDPI